MRCRVEDELPTATLGMIMRSSVETTSTPESSFDARALALLVFAALCGTVIFYWDITFGGRVPSSDGQFAAFFERFQWWSEMSAGGWPPYADLSQMQLYPLRWFFPPSSTGFALFVASAPLVFATGLGFATLSIVGDRRVAAMVALIAPGIGFIGAHLSHTSMIHAAAWIPWMMAFGVLLARGGHGVVLPSFGLAMTTALCWSAGHPQIAVYSPLAVLGGAFLAMPLQTWSIARTAISIGAASSAGVLVALAVIVPAFTLGEGSERSVGGAAYVGQMALPWWGLGGLFVPFAAGGAWVAGAAEPFRMATGTWTEIVAPVGVTIALLASLSILAHDRLRAVGVLWGLVVLSLLLAILPSFDAGAEFAANIPVLNSFRAWARWQIITSIALVLLAAIGLKTLLDSSNTYRASTVAAICAVCLAGVAGLGLTMAGSWDAVHDAKGSLHVMLSQLPIAFAVLVVVGIILSTSKKWVRIVSVFVAVILGVVELDRFADAMAWRNTLANQNIAKPSADALKVKERLDGGGRFLAASGWQSRGLSLEHTRLASIPSLSWYGPLLQSRFATLTGVTNGGWTRPQAFLGGNQALDLYGVRLAEVGGWFATPVEAKVFLSADGIRLGPGCNESNPRSLGPLQLTGGEAFDAVVMFSSLACGVKNAQNEPVGTLDTGSGTHVLRAGIETAEWAHLCLGGELHAAHDRPEGAITLEQQSCRATIVTAEFPIKTTDNAIEIAHTAEIGGLVVHGVALRSNGRWLFLPPGVVDGIASGKWQWDAATESGVLLRNRDWLPRFRFVGEAKAVEDSTAVALIHGVVPDMHFDARKTVLLDENNAALSGQYAVSVIDSIKNVDGYDFRIRRSDHSGEGFLVVGDNFSPSWRAVGGSERLEVLRVNHNQIGIVVPAGVQVIELRYRAPFFSDKFLWVLLLAALVFLGGIYAHRRFEPLDTAFVR